MMKKVLLIIAIVGVALPMWLYFEPLKVAYSQGETEVKCGQITEREFTGDMQQHIYLLSVEPRWSFDVSVKPYGDDLQTVIALYGPTNLLLGFTEGKNERGWPSLQKSPYISSGIVSARGQYTIRVANARIVQGELLNNRETFGGVGFYTLSIGCTTSDGKKIAPGDNPLPTATPAPLPTPTTRATLPETLSTFTGIGFPGLAPVDMSSVARVPLPVEASTYGVSPLDNQIYGFVVNAEAGDTLDLSYARSDGNMNLGLVVLSENNEVFFQASLVTSESLSTRFTLPEAGEYTIGIFRINLVEPAEAEPTLFQIKGVLNPAE